MKKKEEEKKKKKEKKETHRSQFGSSHCRWKSISIGGSLAKKERRKKRERGSLFLSFSISVYAMSMTVNYRFFAPSFFSSSVFEHVTFEPGWREILDDDFCEVYEV